MKKIKLVLSFLVLVFVYSCNEYEKVIGPAIKKKMEDINPNSIFDGTPEPEIPNADINDQTLLGVDSNNNQIRDDIEIWINRSFDDYNKRMVIKQRAIAIRDMMIVGDKINSLYEKGPVNTKNASDVEYSRYLGKEVQRSIELLADSSQCMTAVFNGQQVEKEFKSKYSNTLDTLFTNTELREKAKTAFYTYNHVYKVSIEKVHEIDYCSFKFKY